VSSLADQCLARDLLRRTRAQSGNVDSDGEIVDIHLLERLRTAISPDSTFDPERQLHVVVSLLRRGRS
jgi:hypothetical protein